MTIFYEIAAGLREGVDKTARVVAGSYWRRYENVVQLYPVWGLGVAKSNDPTGWVSAAEAHEMMESGNYRLIHQGDRNKSFGFGLKALHPNVPLLARETILKQYHTSRASLFAWLDSSGTT